MISDIQQKISSLEFEARAFIDGQYVAAQDAAQICKNSSLDGRELPPLTACSSQDVDLAVQAARRSFKQGSWRVLPPEKKKLVMYRFAQLMQDNREQLALIDTLETGRALKNFYHDSIPKAIEVVNWFAESVDKLRDVMLPTGAGSLASVTREPLGVVGLITPWNDPQVVSMWKLIPALLMGNSVVLKPAEQASFSILRVAQLALEAGLPAGVFNVVPGYGEVAGKALALHPGVEGVFFTGSTAVGKLILQYSGQSNMKKVGLECGGKSPYIVTRNCKDLASAAACLAKNMFYNQGQICSAPSRLIVDCAIKEEFLNLLTAETTKFCPGDPLDMDNEVGALISPEQKSKVEKYIAQGKASGARLVYAGHTHNTPQGGCYVAPHIFADLPADSPLLREEIFGPVLVVLDYDEIEAAIALANDSEYGLAAAVWSHELDEAIFVSRALCAGIVHVNSYGEDDNTAPFGGFKQSGLGKDKSLWSFDEYSELKTTWIKLTHV